MSGVEGGFEYHITVAGDDAASAGLAAWAGERGVKFTHIVLARGETVSQPMLTVPGEGTAEAVLAEAEAMAGELWAAGLVVTRLKLESSPFAAGVPATAVEASEEPDDRYFEHHLKLLLSAGVDEAALAELVTPHGAHLSRNARRVRDDGGSERFVTQRCYRVGSDAAVGELARLTEVLRGAGHEIVSSEREYVVYDSSPAVDAGWIG
ncbi:hypothetical protein [Catenulispora pinisilvae]|uniref:hypothetical protein n=1 Tax=Catenulispora pinisilvae TaxID=2705253 RepID=UPI001891CC6C|nr:hypothetical protein [Catenulispora pinisilvae]